MKLLTILSSSDLDRLCVQNHNTAGTILGSEIEIRELDRIFRDPFYLLTEKAPQIAIENFRLKNHKDYLAGFYLLTFRIEEPELAQMVNFLLLERLIDNHKNRKLLVVLEKMQHVAVCVLEEIRDL